MNEQYLNRHQFQIIALLFNASFELAQLITIYMLDNREAILSCVSIDFNWTSLYAFGNLSHGWSQIMSIYDYV